MSHHLIKFLPLDGVVLIILELRAEVGRVLGVVLGPLYEVLIHDPHQGLIVVKSKLVEQRLSDLVDVTHHYTWKQNLDTAINVGLFVQKLFIFFSPEIEAPWSPGWSGRWT